MGTSAIYDELAKGADFLPRIQLYTKGKAIDKHLIVSGHYGVPKSDDEIIDLGESIDIILIARRPKAVDISDTEAIVVSYDPASEEFQRIQDESAESESGCMFGISYLVLERSTGELYEFFFGSKSLRAAAKTLNGYFAITQDDIDATKAAGKNVDGLQPRPARPVTLTSRLVEKGKFTWHVPEFAACSTPFSSSPGQDAINQEAEKFVSAKSEGVTKVENVKRRAR